MRKLFRRWGREGLTGEETALLMAGFCLLLLVLAMAWTERELGIPAYIRNDVHLLGLVEKRLYLPDDLTDFIYVAIRSGIGSIAYQHNKPMRGEKGNAGFIGHTTMNPTGPECCCGSRGCLETYVGQLATVSRYEALTGQQLSFDEMLRRADTGDDVAKQVLQDAGFYLGVALANLVKTYEIPHVIVGGLPEKESAVSASQFSCVLP